MEVKEAKPLFFFFEKENAPSANCRSSLEVLYVQTIIYNAILYKTSQNKTKNESLNTMISQTEISKKYLDKTDLKVAGFLISLISGGKLFQRIAP